jgi:hypothetical protein
MPVQTRDNVIQQKQEQDAQPEADDCGDESPVTHPAFLFHSRYQKTPDGCGHHDARRKSSQCPLHVPAEIPLHGQQLTT